MLSQTVQISKQLTLTSTQTECSTLIQTDQIIGALCAPLWHLHVLRFAGTQWPLLPFSISLVSRHCK
jgi:hypothetical protein